MLNNQELLYPTYPKESDGNDAIAKAANVANRVLHENGMEDFATSLENVSEWDGYLLFSYHNIEDPKLAYGGGARLVVRKSDHLGGMVYSSFDWLEENPHALLANIPIAFSKFDAEQKPSKTSDVG